MKLARTTLVVVLGLSVIAGCTKKEAPVPEPEPDYAKPLAPGQKALVKITDPSKYPDFRPSWHDRKNLAQAVDRSLDYFVHPSSKSFFPYLDVSHERAVASLEAFKKLLGEVSTAQQFHQRITTDFEIYRTVGCNGKGLVLFTGYCQPIYQASLKPTAEFRFPLYRLPRDLEKDELTGETRGRKTSDGKTIPYWTRQEIETGNLLKGRELVWLKSRLEAYVVQVQGSAMLKLPDGKSFEVGYAANNGHPYTSIGDLLIKDGKMRARDRSLPTIRAYFDKHPQDLDKYLFRNPRCVFFMRRQGGPFGSLGQPVTPFRSLATDKSVYPRGCLVYVRTKVPAERRAGKIGMRPFDHWLCDQDTGGAIRATGRADIFMGRGPKAETLAGRTYAEGTLYYIFVKMPGVTATAPTVPPKPTPPPDSPLKR